MGLYFTCKFCTRIGENGYACDCLITNNQRILNMMNGRTITKTKTSYNCYNEQITLFYMKDLTICTRVVENIGMVVEISRQPGMYKDTAMY
jgi:hypothetical protein